MTNLNKTIITYQGGSAGDMFTKSCNGELIGEMSKVFVSQEATLKNYEQKIKEGFQIDLITELSKLNYNYVSTHLFEELLDKGQNLISIIVTDPNVQKTIIYRQLQVQRLRMKIDEQDDWYINTRNLCLSGKFDDAANYWFTNNRDYWLRRMKDRVETNVSHINFNELFTNNFVSSLRQQGFDHNLDILLKNHTFWLTKNLDFSQEKTLASISKKLSLMDWTVKSGWVLYNP